MRRRTIFARRPTRSPTGTARSATCCASSGVIDGDPDPAVELYFRQCALQVDCPRPRADGRHAGQRRRAAAHRRARVRARGRRARAERDDDLRDVRRGRRVGRRRRAAGQERRRRRRARRAARARSGSRSTRRGSTAHGNSVRGVAACRQISRELELHFLHVASERALGDPRAWDVGRRAVEPPPHARRAGDAQRVRRRAPASTRCTATSCSPAPRRSCASSPSARDELEVIVLDITPRGGDRAASPAGCSPPPRPRSPERSCALALVDPDGELDRRRGHRGVRRPRRGDRVGRGPPDRAPRRRGRHHRPDPARRARPRERPAPGGARRAAAAARAPQRRGGRADRRRGPGAGGHLLHRLRPGERRRHRRRTAPSAASPSSPPAPASASARSSPASRTPPTCAPTPTSTCSCSRPAAMRELERRSPRTAIALLRIMFAQSRAAAEPRPAEDTTPVERAPRLKGSGPLVGSST